MARPRTTEYQAKDSFRSYFCRIRQMPEDVLTQDLVEDEVADESTTSVNVVVPGILLLVAIGGAIDLASDRPEKWLSAHVIIEVALMVTSLTFSIILWRGWRRAQHRLARTEASLARSVAERDVWRKSAESALANFSSAVEQQLTAWGLTPAEREVALLLLQGHGHKQIAARTGRSERTVRQHAVSVYEKSGLSGRAELAAFFLEGLMIPADRAGASSTAVAGVPFPKSR